MARIVFISDTHELHSEVEVPDGDILCHTGDFSNRGDIRAVTNFNAWMHSLPHKEKVLIAGNHELTFESNPQIMEGLIDSAIYLKNSGIELAGLKFWGSPWTPYFYNWAFNLKTEEQTKSICSLIPSDTDILLTHGPPRGILDSNLEGISCGCPELLRTVQELKPKVHAFGHIHEAHGYQAGANGTHFVNSSAVTRNYQVPKLNRAIVLDVSTTGVVTHVVNP